MMTNYESNMIKPVDGLHNITGVSPTRRREQRSRRHNLHKENEDEQQLNESVDEQATENPPKDREDNGNHSQNNRIDYQA